jgi:hypothetical protein
MSGPPFQRNIRPRARALAKQAPTHTTPRSPRSADLQHPRAVMMERSRPSRRPKCPHPLLRPHYHDDHDYPDKASPCYNGYNHTQKPASESSTHSQAQGLHPADALTRTHREHEEHHQHQDCPTEPERDSLTPPQARGLLTGPGLGPPFDGKNISLKHKVTQHC